MEETQCIQSCSGKANAERLGPIVARIAVQAYPLNAASRLLKKTSEPFAKTTATS